MQVDFVKRSDRFSGFTLIELLVVMTIIAALVALLLPNFVGIRGRASDATLKSDLRSFKTALQLYYNDNQSYPAAAPSVGAIFDDGSSTVYMREVPTYDDYQQINGGQGFYMYVVLDNEADQDAAASATRCSIGSPEDFAYYVCSD